MNLQNAFITLGVDLLDDNTTIRQAYERKMRICDVSKYMILDATLVSKFEERKEKCRQALLVIQEYDADNSIYEATDFFDLKVVYQRKLLGLINSIDENVNPSLSHYFKRIMRGYAMQMELARTEAELEELYNNATQAKAQAANYFAEGVVRERRF